MLAALLWTGPPFLAIVRAAADPAASGMLPCGQGAAPASQRQAQACRTRRCRLSALWTNHFFTIMRSWLRGELVGKDEHGNRYYRERPRKNDSWRRERRWVLFNGSADPTEVPPGWVGWLHKRIELPPSKVPLPAPRWEQDRLPNLTGTDQAYLPPGAIQRGGHRDPATGDYEAWRPE
jgi:NADH:ubiquinone oxidoreductase subunit